MAEIMKASIERVQHVRTCDETKNSAKIKNAVLFPIHESQQSCVCSIQVCFSSSALFPDNPTVASSFSMADLR